MNTKTTATDLFDKTAVLIPARYGSTRFPGKPLALLDGVPMIKRVADAAHESGLPVYVLTDNQSVANAVNKNYTVIIDNTDYANGTERCAGAIKTDFLQKYDRFINVQGDMPDITADIIKKIALNLNYYTVVTAYTDMDPVLRADPNAVKVIVGEQQAHWFGRGFTYGYHHLGVYGYRRYQLEQYATLPASEEENIEKLEQLRWYSKDIVLGAVKVEFNGTEINAPEDVKKWMNNR